MICGKMQGLLIKKTLARSAKDLAAARRALRRHVETCDFCMKQYRQIKKRLKPL